MQSNSKKNNEKKSFSPKNTSAQGKDKRLSSKEKSFNPKKRETSNKEKPFLSKEQVEPKYTKPFYKKASKPHTSDESKGIRLNKYIANAGICARREADRYISAGNVEVNGKPMTELGYRVQPSDVVKFDGKVLSAEKKEYILLNKPKGFITTTQDEKGRKTVMELIAGAAKRTNEEAHSSLSRCTQNLSCNS